MNIRILLSGLYLAAVLCVVPVSFASAQFTSAVPLQGHAWSSNIGWVSVDGPGYGVEIGTDGSLTGYAWSSNIGWIKFDGLSNYPAGGGAAQIDLATSAVSGWVRACAGTANGDCSTMTDHVDGWDGWISLNCSNTGTCGTSSYSTSASGGQFSGYAWGSDVVGWLRWSGTGYGVIFATPCAPGFQCTVDLSGYEQTNQWCEVVNTSSCNAGYVCDTGNPGSCTPDEILATIQARPAVARQGETVDITWNASNATDCTVYQQNPGATNAISIGTGLTGTETSNVINTLTVFSLACTDIAGVDTSEVASTTVRVLPTLIET